MVTHEHASHDVRLPSPTDAVDALLEAPIVPSFTRVGYGARSALERWDHDVADLGGRTMVVTGATSGLGRAATSRLAHAGATVLMVARDEARLEQVRVELTTELAQDRATGELELFACDLSDLDAVRRLAAHIQRSHDRIDVLVHNAGALSATRTESTQGIETTVAAQVLGPFLLTSLLLSQLRQGRPGRVLTMSSGGMYSAPLSVSSLQMGDDYRGSEQYARAKRAQVTLNEMWAERVAPSEVVMHALHPGWADTPGVRSSLPRFARTLGPLLRTPEQGADTLVWLASDDGEPLARTGAFWLDRRVRPIHRLARTRRSDTPERRAALWDRCVQLTGVEP